jgi:hypothetical protein
MRTATSQETAENPTLRGRRQFLVTIENAGEDNRLPYQGGLMKRSTGPRNTANLSESVHQQLSMYALAAGAAGVSVLALAQPAEAKIVYTSTHVVIDEYSSIYHLDLNHDGATDFVLSLSRSCDSFCASRLLANGQAGNGAEGVGYAAALHRGAKIGPNHEFGPFMVLVAHTYGLWERSRGPWRNVTNRYLGLKFLIKGRTHYGWARLNVKVQKPTTVATLTGYAFEDIAGKSIIAGRTKGPDDPTNDFSADASLTSPILGKPQPAWLGVLALGAPGIPWRRKGSALESAH